MKQGVVSDKGFLLFTGGVGTGKTTLINVLSKSLDNPGYLCVISNPCLGIDDFFHYFAAKLGLLFDGNRAKFLFIFTKLLEESKKNKRKVLLIVDEAHALPTELLEEIRLLVNMAVEVKNVLSIFLVGQPELLNRLTEEQLSPLSERIAVRYHLRQLCKEEALQYISFRLEWSGYKGAPLFTRGALDLIYEATDGNPRQINILCDNALFAAYSRDRIQIDGQLIRECASKLFIPGDESAFFLRPEKPFWSGMLIATAFGVLLLEGAGAAYAYQKGWLQPIFRYLLNSLGWVE
ncbi:MAG: AAA family ATPase [Desulforhopalus sp.]|nr:AAA family ATPase [Desulforhopalus sp.]